MMRWKLADDAVAEAQLSLFPEHDVVDRHVGIGEYAGLEFLHVRAKRLINEVPGAPAHLPFRWTINAYRGCSHACVYCMSPETPVLRADGTHVALAELHVGDEVYGTERIGQYRVYRRTPVLAKWNTVKRAYRVTLEDGTSLVASGDHRFLSNGGWTFVTGLTTTNHLLGTGRFADQPKHDDDYRHGYVAGAFAGDVRDAEASSASWRKGFVAGLFDAEGSCSRGVLRLTNTDPRLLACFLDALVEHGFRAVVEPPSPGVDRPVLTARLVGGQVERMRFFHTFDPAITRKRDIEGARIENDARLRVVSVEDLGFEMPMVDITTGTGDFIANGVVSHNCFARPTHDYLGLNIGSDFDTKIVVKINAVERLRAELKASRWQGHHIAMGTNTDPYQRAEGKYHLTQGIVRVLGEHRNPFSILTKSTLILRDLDLLVEANRRTDVRLNFSIGTLDERTWKATEPGTPHPRRRVEAVKKLTDAGLECGVLVAPIIPGMSDAPEQIDEVVAACNEAGAASITKIDLFLKPGVKEHWMAWLQRARPDLVPRYERLYARGSRLAKRRTLEGS